MSHVNLFLSLSEWQRVTVRCLNESGEKEKQQVLTVTVQQQVVPVPADDNAIKWL